MSLYINIKLSVCEESVFTLVCLRCTTTTTGAWRNKKQSKREWIITKHQQIGKPWWTCIKATTMNLEIKLTSSKRIERKNQFNSPLNPRQPLFDWMDGCEKERKTEMESKKICSSRRVPASDWESLVTSHELNEIEAFYFTLLTFYAFSNCRLFVHKLVVLVGFCQYIGTFFFFLDWSFWHYKDLLLKAKTTR